MDKRGIAPLVATLLLIGFAVAVGIVIMNFGRAQVEVAAHCSVDVGLHFSEIDGEKQVCYDSGKNSIFVILENGANIKVTGVVMNIIGTSGTATQELTDAQMDKVATYLKNINYDKGTNGDIRQIKFTPKITVNKEELICSEMALSTSKVPDCKA